MAQLYVGTAGWSIPKTHASNFPRVSTQLERYAQVLTAVEINSSFYRSHKPSTYTRWAASVPDGFRFTVKMPREITHMRKLVDVAECLTRFLAEIEELGKKLGPVLVQLPPSLRYNEVAALNFFESFRTKFAGGIACEPRHSTWFTEAVNARFEALHIARVVADPPVVPHAIEPGGNRKLLYLRLHGAPKIYYSPYGPEQISKIAAVMRRASDGAAACWCIFDNTALGEATKDALDLVSRFARP